MTEAEWLSRADPQPMLEFLRGKASDRKLRLFACACCRHMWDLLSNKWSRKAVFIAEAYADGLISKAKLRAAWRGATDAERWALLELRRDGGSFGQLRDRWEAANAVVVASLVDGILSWNAPIPLFRRAEQLQILHEIVGSPFHPVTLDSRWPTSNVLDLARTIYDERAFDRLPILADALMDAGCADEGILSHCRSEGPHVRGCWVVDLILGKK
jgi:hypothetical protein